MSDGVRMSHFSVHISGTEMEGRRMATRNKPRGQAPVASIGTSRAASRVSRGGRGCHRAQTVNDGHVSSVYETNTEYYDSTYVLETEHEETPYDGSDTHTNEDNH
ncbi:unnamed protein product [Cuscuta epithymum]|uniref:Uncharacterized protein n=1 Tax=Cuscuta epithymum TaxID=186058 RepID=A0AAV0GEV5_9ASTE|nr:unnamed protein product [Cuscuta epithymum]